jgi:mono/diheme cytochrome c family protein
MNGARWLWIIAMVGLSTLLGATVATADPVASAESAWAPLTKAATDVPKNARQRRGQEVFEQRCAACHAAVPKDMIGPPYMPPMPGTQALQARYKGAKPAELEQRTDLSAEFLKAIVRGGLNSMPFFRPTELSDDDLAALSAYLTLPHR